MGFSTTNDSGMLSSRLLAGSSTCMGSSFSTYLRWRNEKGREAMAGEGKIITVRRSPIDLHLVQIHTHIHARARTHIHTHETKPKMTTRYSN